MSRTLLESISAIRRQFSLFLILAMCVAGMGLSSFSSAQDSSAVQTSQVKEHLKEILAQPEFHPEVAKNPFDQSFRFIQEQWDKLGKWFQSVRDWLNKLFRGSGEGGLPFANFLVYAVMVILIAVLIIFIVHQLREYGGIRTRALKRSVFDLEEGEEDSFSRDPESWMSQARSHADSKEYQKAYRAAFIATMLDMDIAGMVEFAKSNTNGDYLRQLRIVGRDQLSSLFEPLVYEFDSKFYGEEATTEADYRELLKSREAILHSMPKEPILSTVDTLIGGVVGEAT